MSIRTQILSEPVYSNTSLGILLKNNVLPGEINGLNIEYISVRGPLLIKENIQEGFYYVLLSLKGSGHLLFQDKKYDINSKSIARIPFGEQYSIEINEGQTLQYLCFRKQMEEPDFKIISNSVEIHSFLYLRAISSCPVYSEDIKSSKTISRMILQDGFVPRFCIGSVETTGPDIVAEHEHPMLDQLFFGLDNCKCTLMADGEQILLTENMMLHVPLGSKHSVSVAEGDTLAYIWLDFFFTTEGEKYMEEQHHPV